MEWKSVKVPAAAIGPKAWRERAIKSVGLAEAAIEITAHRYQDTPFRSATLFENQARRLARRKGCKYLPGELSENPESLSKYKSRQERIQRDQETVEEAKKNVCEVKAEKDVSSDILYKVPEGTDSGWGFKVEMELLPFLRDLCAMQSNEQIGSYTLQTRSVIGHLCDQINRMNSEIFRLKETRDRLRLALADVRKGLVLNRMTNNMRKMRPILEREPDGADLLIGLEKTHLQEIKPTMEAPLHTIKDILQVVGFPACDNAMNKAKSIVTESRLLREKSDKFIEQSIVVIKGAQKSVNDGLTQKMAENVAMTQHMEVSAGETRAAIYRTQRWYDEMELSSGVILVDTCVDPDVRAPRREGGWPLLYDRGATRRLVFSAADPEPCRMTEWEGVPAVAETPEIKLFGKWSTDDVQINDISLQDYIAVKEKYAKYLPHSSGRYAAKRFRKAQCPIVERLTNSMMMHGRNNGKKLMTVRIVKHAFEIIHLLTGENPLQVLVNAIINSGPREDSTRIGRAGTVRRQAVDVSPLRRVNQAIWLLCTGAREAAFRNIKTIAECLADELINAAKGSSNSYAIKKKDELERVAKSNR
ncbi:hypothetical protein scyTo_0002944 [Scyliorhinus torazame]|uniref:Small ribosomal subunit protein uS7 n=2 Tax=Scyliorhinus TaxID=7829 RepID=A0A401PL47_SCYTO|nr:hypothetical protein [Scyliorhinus torazame]